MIYAENISKEFYRKSAGTNVFTAVKPTDIELKDEGLYVITGRSGSGKTTLMNMLAGLLKPTSGHVYIDNTDLYEMDDEKRSEYRRENIGYIPQGNGAIYSLSVIENIILPYTMYRSDNSLSEKSKSVAHEYMKKLGIYELANAKPKELSGGELRRMSIARALVKGQGIVFADEPTGDLDDENTNLVFDILRQVADSGRTVLMISHEPDVKKYADTVFTMSGGEIHSGG